MSRALRLFKEGDDVRARILSVDVEKRKVNFGLKPSYFAHDPKAASLHGADIDLPDDQDQSDDQDSKTHLSAGGSELDVTDDDASMDEPESDGEEIDDDHDPYIQPSGDRDEEVTR
jgi:rRNA biogenesis protein RRP5